MHKAWSSIEEVPYCFSRSSVEFQGHTALKIVEFDPNWPFPDSNSSLNTPMAMKCWSSIEEVPYCLARSYVKLQGHTALKIVDFDPNWAFPDCISSLESLMATKWCTKLEVALKRCPIVFQGHPSNFKVTRLWKSLNLTQIVRFRTVIQVWNHQWLRNDAQSLKWHRRGALLFLAATKQLYKWYFPSVRPCVRLSVCPSVRLSVTPFSPCSHHGIIMKFSGDITMVKSDVHAKGQGQRSKVKVTEVNTQLSRFRTLTPVWIHIWQWNHAHSWKHLEEVPYCFQGHPSNFKVTRLWKSSKLTQIGRFRTVTPVWIHKWLRNDAQSLK